MCDFFPTLPVVYPTIMTLGYDPVWFGIALVILLEVDLIKPPVGINLFIIQGIAKSRFGTVEWEPFPSSS